jgi:hypothetical protein
MTAKLLPTGHCWCGCGDSNLALGSFFSAGHDKRAESKVIIEVFGSVPRFLVAFGYGPTDARPVEPELIRLATNAKALQAMMRLLAQCSETTDAIRALLEIAKT